MNQNKVYSNEYLFKSETGDLITIDLSTKGVSPRNNFENELYNKLKYKLNELPENVEREIVNRCIEKTLSDLECSDWQGGCTEKVTLITNVEVLDEDKFNY